MVLGLGLGLGLWGRKGIGEFHGGWDLEVVFVCVFVFVIVMELIDDDNYMLGNYGWIWN